MRIIGVIVGAVVLLGSGALVVAADQERLAALDEARDAVAEKREQLEKSRAVNEELTEALSTLRSQIAEQDKQLADTTGMLQ
ncbi:MAG: hypothetical protein QM630_06205 [Microbacterium sp.]